MKKARLLNLSNLKSLSYIATIMNVLSINEVKSHKTEVIKKIYMCIEEFGYKLNCGGRLKIPN